MKKTIVLGLGNPLMSDEGIGSCLIEQLAKLSDKYPSVDFIDAGTGGMNLLHMMAGRKKVLVIDCALMGTEPGTIKKFTPNDVATVKQLVHLSLHEVDIVKVIKIATQLGQCPREISIFGIEPEHIRLEQKLSDTLSSKITSYIKAICEEL